MIDQIVKKLDEWTEPMQDFFMSQHDNPIFWIIVFVIGLAVFALTYNALHRD